MNATLLDNTIETYRRSLTKLDSHARENLDEGQWRDYVANRERFEQQLKAWQKTLGSDLAIFSKNVEDSYNELEAKLV